MRTFFLRTLTVASLWVISVHDSVVFLDVNEVVPLSVEVLPPNQKCGGCYQFLQKQVGARKPELSVTPRQHGQLGLVAGQCVL